MSALWEEIRGFVSLGEFSRFERYIEEQIAAGVIRESSVDKNYGQGEIYGGRWFEDLESKEIWRLVPPDPPFKGLWEPVREKR